MYSVSHGLNSGCITFLALTRSADLALRRSTLWVWMWCSTSRLVLARRADSWIYRGKGGGREREEYPYDSVPTSLCHTAAQPRSSPHGLTLQGKRCASFYLPRMRPSPLIRREQKDVFCAYCPPCAAALTQHRPAGSALNTWRVYSVWFDQLLFLQCETDKIPKREFYILPVDMIWKSTSSVNI